MTEPHPIFETVFGEKWSQLPNVFKRHYANRAYAHDKVTVTGKITIQNKGMMKWLGPLFGMLRTLPPNAAKDVPITVDYVSYPDSNAFHLQRTFYYPNRPAFTFHSKMIPLHDNVLMELTPCFFGWKMSYEYNADQVKLKHLGFVLKVWNWYMPLPIEWMIGQCNAVETVVSDNEFKMRMQFTHPWFGVLYEYYGNFTLI